jgi:DnaJ-class molecular chaperone
MKWRNLKNSYESRIEILRGMDPYELLEVDRDISINDLKKEYYKKLKTYHPDKNYEFMKDYGDEYTKLLNTAFDKIEKDIEG